MATQTRKIVIDTAALLAGRVVGLLLGLVRLNILATLLGVAGFGVLNFAAIFSSLVQTMFDLGLPQLLTRELARDPSHQNHLVGKTVVLKITVAGIAGIIVLSALAVSGFDAVTNLAVVLSTLALATNGITQVYLSAFQAQRRMILVSGFAIFTDVIVSIAIILAIPAAPHVHVALLLALAGAAINLVAVHVVYRHLNGAPEFGISISTWRLLLQDSLPLALSSLGMAVYMFVGPTMLNYVRGKDEVGIFSAGFKLITILSVIPASFSQVLYPIFSGFVVASARKLHKALEDSLRVMVEISIPLAVGTVILAPKIIALVYPSPAYAGAVDVLRLLIIGTAVGYLAWILYTFLISINRQRFCMVFSLATAAVVIAANALLTPAYGYLAVAGISMATEFLLFTGYLLYVWRAGYAPVQPGVVLKVLAAAGVMAGLLVLAEPWHLVPAALAGAAVYAAMVYVLRVFGDQERELLNKLLGRWVDVKYPGQ